MSAFIISSGVCTCTDMVLMCVLYASFGSQVRPRIFGCVAMGSAVLFILRSRLLLYSAGFGMNRVQVVLSGFSVRLLCFVQEKLYVFLGCTRACVCRCDAICIYHDKNRCSACWHVCSVNVK